ncbi:MAG: hypothetical protein KBD04_03545 [Proteobacteria bacterium]|nr:hypothetical protein [Pseudomonadota bacterium]
MINPKMIIKTVYCTLPLLFAAEPQSLVMPHDWIDRSDVFNYEEDLKALLRKCKVSGALTIKNNTDNPVCVKAFGKVDAATELIDIDLTINAGETNATLNFFVYENFKLNTGSFGFLNFYTTQSGFEVSVEQQPMLLFPQRSSPFSFAPTINSSFLNLSLFEINARLFEKKVCAQEKIISADLFQQRENLYKEHCLEEIMKSPLPIAPRIPLNLFSIWLTNIDDPKMPDTEFIEIAKANSRNNPHADGWNYYFLVQDILLAPMTTAFEGTDIQVIAFAELLGTLELQAEFDEALAENNFGRSSDILRVEALRKMGGAYLDTDLLVFHSLKPYFYFYDSVFGVEPTSVYIGNAFMACKTDHPITNELTNLIRRNLQHMRNRNKKFYTEIPPDKKLNAILQTGPCAVSIAFFKAANRDGNVDIAMPPEVFFPGISLGCPESGIPGIEDAMGISTATLHLWRNSWTGK